MTLLDLIGDYGYNVEQRGLEYWLSCPFHEDHTPSFSVSPNEDGYVFYCFSCKKGGGPIQFIQYHDHVSPRHAKSTWDVLNGRVVKTDPVRDKRTTWIDQRAEDLLKDKAGMGFFLDRDISMDTVRYYKIGIDGTSIIYPFFDYDGVIKYHTRELGTKIYKSEEGRILWGLYQIPYEADTVYVVEGYQDVLSCYEVGIPAVGMCGSVMHREYWDQLFERGIRTVVLCPDGDTAGQSLLMKAVKDYDLRFRVRFCKLPSDEDPDSLLSGGVTKLPLTDHPVVWYVKERWGQVYSEETKLAMYDDVAPLVSRLSIVEREVIRSWFETGYGDESIRYLHGKITPDLMAEEYVIGNCLYTESIRLETIGELTVDCFHTKIGREAYGLIVEHDTPTPEFVDTVIGKRFDMDPINQKEYVARVKRIATIELVEKELAKSLSMVQGDDPERVVGNLVEKLYESVDSKVNVHESGDVVKRVMLSINERVDSPSLLGIPFNEKRFPILNRLLLGFVPNKLILLSGPTGHGKTTLACNWIDDLIFEQKQNVLFASLEMTPEEIIEKQLTIRTGIMGAKMLTGSLEKSEYEQLIKAGHEFISSRLKIVYGVYDLQRLVGIIKSQILKSKVRVVFLDYVQLVRVQNDKARWEQLMDITTALKTRIASMGVTVVAISQLGKASLLKDNPESSDVSGSYGMLADPDVAIAIKRRSGRDIQEGANFMIHIDKHRYGLDQVMIDAVFDRNILQIREKE